MGRITEAVKHLLIINVIMFIATQVSVSYTHLRAHET